MGDVAGKGVLVMRRPILSAWILLLVASSLPAQKGTTSGSSSGATGSTGSTGGTGGRTPTVTQPTPSNQPSGNQVPQQPTPIFLYGRVMMDDGTSPPSSTAVKQVCTGNGRTVAFTSGKGDFNFQLGSRTLGAIFDASETFESPIGGAGGQGGMNVSGMGGTSSFAMSLAGCELIAELAGFRSDRLDLTSRLRNDNPDVGIIVLHRIAGVEGTSISATTLAAPKDARKAWEKGVQTLRATQSAATPTKPPADAKLAGAEKEFLSAVTIYPKFASAWNDLGRTRLMRGNNEGAREAFLKAMETDNKLVEPYVALGEQSIREKDWKAAAQYMGKALQLDPVDYPALWFENAVANYNLQNYDRAEKDARESLKLPAGKSNPHANELLGLILMNKRDYAGAKEALNAFLKISSKPEESIRVRQELEEIERQLPEPGR